MNQPTNKIILPIIALIIPLIIYFAFFSLFKPVSDVGFISIESLGYTAIIVYFFFLLITHMESRSQYRFFVRRNKKDENSPIPHKGTLFFCHTMANSVAIVLWFSTPFIPENLGNIFGYAVILLITMFIAGLAVKFFLSVYFLKLPKEIILNSLKFVLIFEIISYGLWIAYFVFYIICIGIFLGGVF